jgi:hypothetical protein
MPVELPTVSSFISRAAQECGFERERFVDSNIPEDFDKIVIFVFFGDMRAFSITSMLLFKSYRDAVLSDKYVVVCSFPGMGALFSGADEFWSISDGLAIGDLMDSGLGFKNTDKKFDSIVIQLRRRFYTVLTGEDLLTYYDNGITNAYFDRFKQIKRFFPSVPYWRGGELNMSIAKRGGVGIFLFPNIYGRCWDRGREVSLKFSKDFWIKLTERLLDSKFVPVVYQNQVSYDISPHFGERCFYCSDRNFVGVLSAMRSTGCVLDMFSGISRIAIMARCPFLVVDERQRYIRSKEFEINDLCVAGMYPYRYIFSFPTMIGSGNYAELIDQTMNVGLDFIPMASKVELPPATESFEEVPYDIVREHKAKKLGVHFIKVERLVIK